MTIALLCPTRARPKQCKRMIESAYNTSKDTVNIYLGFTDESYCGGGYQLPDYPTAHKWNMLAIEAMKDPSNKLFMLAADDMIFTTPCWDQALLDHYNALDNKVHVYALQDSRDPNGTPHPIVTREYIEALGWFLPPIFMHWYVDSWTVEIAKANNCFTHMKDYLLVHDKPSDKGQADETHNRIRGMGWHERDKYVAEKCTNYLEQQILRLSLAMKMQRAA